MTWTKDKPTTPGYYWHYVGEHPTVMKIYDDMTDLRVSECNGVRYNDLLATWPTDGRWWSTEPISEPPEGEA